MDLHVHFESSMLTPAGYAAAMVPHGTTTVFADPHELGNGVGLAGVRYAVDASRGLPLRFVIQARSCVPPAPEWRHYPRSCRYWTANPADCPLCRHRARR